MAEAQNPNNNDNQKDIKIGELLTEVGIVTTGDLTEAIQIAKRMNLPIGRVIVMSGVISEEQLQHAIEAQSLIRDGLLEVDTAVTALKGAYQKNKTLQEALSDLRWAPKQDVTTNKLGELLIDSMMVSQAQLEQALQTSFDTGMPLGGTLVLQGVLSAQLLPAVLNAQEQIREGRVTREQAIGNLKSAVMFWAQATESQQETGRRSHQSLQREEPSRSMQSRSLEATVGAQPRSFLEEPAAKPWTAEAQRPALPAGYDAAAAAAASTDMGLVEMMKLSGFCTSEDIQQALVNALSNSEIAAKIFLATGLLTTASLDNFVRCRSLIRKNIVSPQQALYALGISKSRGITLDDAFEDMNVKVPRDSSW